ncbi:MAG: GGDEF domain-containing protein [Pseudomonadota bacterium]
MSQDDGWKLYLGVTLFLLSLTLLAFSSLASAATLMPMEVGGWLVTGWTLSAALLGQHAFLLIGLGLTAVMVVLLHVHQPAQFNQLMMNESVALPNQSRSNVVELPPRTQRTSRKPPAEWDELTGLMNVRAFRAMLERRWSDARYVEQDGCIITWDLDQFSAFNECFGRASGDHLLCAVARSMGRLVAAQGGSMARYGGEEFIAYIPGFNQAEGEEFAARLRRAIISLEFSKPGPLRGFVTASFGVSAASPVHGVSPQALIEAADRALYAAKQQGRNRVESSTPLQHPLDYDNVRELLARAV